jgi:hypothetical protein
MEESSFRNKVNTDWTSPDSIVRIPEYTFRLLTVTRPIAVISWEPPSLLLSVCRIISSLIGQVLVASVLTMSAVLLSRLCTFSWF